MKKVNEIKALSNQELVNTFEIAVRESLKKDMSRQSAKGAYAYTDRLKKEILARLE